MIMNKTKIIATVGPATYSREVLVNMIREGVNVVRINFSHGTYDEYKSVIQIYVK